MIGLHLVLPLLFMMNRVMSDDTAANSSNSSMSADEVLSRRKRFLYFTSNRRFALPPGSILSVQGIVSMPFSRGMPLGYNGGTNLELPITMALDTLQWTSDENPFLYLPFGSKRKKRQLKFGGDRVFFYQIIEDFLHNLGMDGHTCLLRAICETHELPFNAHGFFGEVLRMMLTASLAYDLPEDMDVYIEAEKLGANYNDCSRYKKKCPHTMYGNQGTGLPKKEGSDRQSRFLYFTSNRRISLPIGSEGVAFISLGMNNFRGAYQGTSMSMSITTTLTLAFDELGWTHDENPFFDLTPLGLARKKRGAPEGLPRINVAGGDRELMYPEVERYIESFDMDGKACLLRAICEIQEKPVRSYNIIGEIMEIFLKPTHAPYPEERLAEYVAAERAGRLHGECSPYIAACGSSLFKDDPSYSIPLTPEAKEYFKDFLGDAVKEGWEAM